jgi:hypothetical protein
VPLNFFLTNIQLNSLIIKDILDISRFQTQQSYGQKSQKMAENHRSARFGHKHGEISPVGPPGKQHICVPNTTKNAPEVHSNGHALFGKVWPSKMYARQIERLRLAIGKQVYLLDLSFNGVDIAAILKGEPCILLDVLDFPRPDPSGNLYPHIAVFDDGRGINLGRIARITINRTFDPAPRDMLYQQMQITRALLFRKQRLSAKHVARISHIQLARLLGKTERRALK